MTHRSVGVFIILAALLVAVPQASRDLMGLAGEAGAQARSAVLRAFLGLNAGGAVAASAPRSSQALASCRTAEARQGAARQSQAAGRARQAARPDPEADGAGYSELAMILDRPADGPPAPPAAEALPEPFEFSHTPAPRPRDAVGVSELAMIIPPDASIPPLAAVLKAERLKTVAASDVRVQVNPALVAAAGLRSGEAALLRSGVEEIRREVYAFRKEGAAVGAKTEALVKACAARAAEKKGPEPLVCGAPQFIKVAPLPAPPAPAYYIEVSE